MDPRLTRKIGDRCKRRLPRLRQNGRYKTLLGRGQPIRLLLDDVRQLRHEGLRIRVYANFYAKIF
jgi:hypothetical protein